MREIAPCLINHNQPPVDLTAGVAVAGAGQDGSGGSFRPKADPRPPTTTGYYINRMRPAHPPVPTPSPTAGTSAAPEQTLAHVDAGKEENVEPEVLAKFVELLERHHGLSSDAATAICLVSLSATIGPGRTLKHPLGGVVSAALNLVVEDATHAPVQRAAFQALAPFQRWVTRKIATHQEKGTKRLRQARMEIELECARAIHRLRSPPEKPREPFTLPVPAEERKREAQAAALGEAGQVAARLAYSEFEERPFLMVDGLGARDLLTIPQRAFDGALLNFSPYGHSLRNLETTRSRDRREVLRYLVAAWHGQPYLAGAGTNLSPMVTNLWLAAPGDIAKAWRNPAIAVSGLPGTFLLVTNGTCPEPGGRVCSETEITEKWSELIEVVIGERIRGETAKYELSEPAAKRFSEFHAHTLRQQGADTRSFIDWWPEQLLKITLILHLGTLRPEVPQQVELATMEAAVGVMERLGAAQLRDVPSLSATRKDCEAEIEIMVAKVRLHGPLKKRDLFRKYNAQEYRHLEPILALCQDRQQLRLEDDLIYPALPD